MSIPEIAKAIDVDTLNYLSIENVRKIAEEAHCGLCSACFDGNYPVEVPKEMPKNKFEYKISERNKE